MKKAVKKVEAKKKVTKKAKAPKKTETVFTINVDGPCITITSNKKSIDSYDIFAAIIGLTRLID